MIIAGIQYLRALAALSVIIFHAAHGAAFAHAGHRGVDVFFVISGFIVTYTTYGRVRRTGDGAAARAFFTRRILRIAPLYFLCLALSAMLRLRYGPPPLSLLLDFAFIAHPHAAHPSHCWPYLVPGWSLNYEVFFYALFALGMLLGRRHALLTGALMLALSGLGSVLALGVVARFYLAPFGAEFSLGIAIASLHLATRLRPPPVLARIVCAACTFALFAPHANQQAADALLAAGMVYGALYAFDGVRLPWAALLGDASYATYLVHTEVVSLVRGYLLTPLGLDDTARASGLLGMALCVAAALGAGVWVHRHVEEPLRRLVQARLPRRVLT
jgi:exopolysaccharide production protein ExoZ